jgi:hypothetical protein
MGLLGSSFSSVAKRVFDRFNRVNQTGLGFTEDNTQWDIIRPGFNIVSQKAEATNTDYPMAVVPFSGDVVISLSGISQGSSAALWVSDADNWWAVGIDQEPIQCNCQTGTNCIANNSASCNPTSFPISCTEYRAAWTVPTAWRYNSGTPTAFSQNAPSCQTTRYNAGICQVFSGGGCSLWSGGTCAAWSAPGCGRWLGGNAATWNQSNCRAFAPRNCVAYSGGNCSSWNSAFCSRFVGGNCAANNSSNCRAWTGGNCASSSCASSSCGGWRCNRWFRGRCVSTSCAFNRCNSWRCNRFNARNCSSFNSTSCARWNSRNCAAYSGRNCRTFNSTFCAAFVGGGCTSWNARNVTTWNARICDDPRNPICTRYNSRFCRLYAATNCVVRTGNNSFCSAFLQGNTFATRWSQQTSFVSGFTTRWASTTAAVSSANCSVIRTAYSSCCTAQSSFDECQGQISSWNSTSCRTFENFQFGCQTCYPQYIRILQSTGSVVSEVFSWTVNSIINSLKIKTRGEEITISAYSDESLTTQIGSDIVYTPTGVTVHPSYGITIQPSGQNQGFSFDTFEITRN